MASEFVVNSYTENWQTHPDVAVLKDGSFIVVWDSFYSEDVDFNYIAAQRFDANGAKIGGEFIVDSDLASDSYYATVAALNDGGYAVAWQSSDGSPIVDGSDVYARSFNRNGTPRGASDRVNTRDEEYQYAADIVALDNGGYAVGFTSSRGSGDSQHDDILLQRYGADGDPRGTNTRVNQVGEHDQEDSKSAMLSNGDIVVIWDAEWAGVGDNPGDIDQVHGRIIAPSGVPRTADFVVSYQNDGHYPSIVAPETSISVAALPSNRFVATWQEDTIIDGTSDVRFDIHARIFKANGRPVGREFVVEGSREGIPEHTEVVALADGGFVVAWDNFGVGGNANRSDVFARVFDDDGHALGDEFRVNQLHRNSNQEEPSLAALPGGGFVAVYQSEGIDGSDEGIAGRLFGQGTAGNDVEAMRWTGTFRAFQGNDRITGTDGSDRILGGGGRDVLAGRRGGDVIVGDAGLDTVRWLEVRDSTGLKYDTIVGFDANAELFDLPVAVTGIDPRIASGRLSESSFNGDLAAAANAAALLAHHAVVFNPDRGAHAGEIFLVVDANGVAGYQAGGDFVSRLQNPTHLGGLSTDRFA